MTPGASMVLTGRARWRPRARSRARTRWANRRYDSRDGPERRGAGPWRDNSPRITRSSTFNTAMRTSPGGGTRARAQSGTPRRPCGGRFHDAPRARAHFDRIGEIFGRREQRRAQALGRGCAALNERGDPTPTIGAWRVGGWEGAEDAIVWDAARRHPIPDRSRAANLVSRRRSPGRRPVRRGRRPAVSAVEQGRMARRSMAASGSARGESATYRASTDRTSRLRKLKLRVTARRFSPSRARWSTSPAR